MKHAKWIVTLSLAVVMAFATAASAKPKPPKTCDSTALADANAAIAAVCPCAGKTDPSTGTVVPWKNHGEYVSCVSQARNAVKKAGGVPKQCLNAVVPCAANSGCGSSGAVACVVTTGVCLDDPTPGDAVAEGTCDIDSSGCDTNADCAQSTCQVASSTAACAGMGGSAVGLECCQ